MKKLYLRFKDIPENEISNIYRGDSGKIGEEIGVSCIELTEDLLPIIPIKINKKSLTYKKNVISFLNDLSWMLDDFFSERITAYIITGNKVGIGSDGEPLLKDIKIIQKLKPIVKVKPVIQDDENEAIVTQVDDKESIISNLKKIQSNYENRENESEIEEIFKLIKKL